MSLVEFKLEKWLNPKGLTVKYNLGASYVKPFYIDEFFKLIGEDVDEFYKHSLRHMNLNHGHSFVTDRLVSAISKMYLDTRPKHILVTHGAVGANNIVINEIVEPDDNVVVFLPNYQQHYSIPKALGAEVRYLILKEENNYLPDLDELNRLVDKKTKMIILSNPNNPTGSFMGEEALREMCQIADSVSAYILCDEIYKGLDDEYMTSVVDIYEKGIVTSSMSKVFAMPGTRIGWVITKDKKMLERIENRKFYNTISCGPFDELMSAVALENYKIVLERSRNIVKNNKSIFQEWIKTQDHIFCRGDSISTTSIISYDYSIDSVDLCTDLFENKKLLLCHGDCFEMRKSFRIGYGVGDSTYFKKCLDILDDYINNSDNLKI